MMTIKFSDWACIIGKNKSLGFLFLNRATSSLAGNFDFSFCIISSGGGPTGLGITLLKIKASNSTDTKILIECLSQLCRKTGTSFPDKSNSTLKIQKANAIAVMKRNAAGNRRVSIFSITIAGKEPINPSMGDVTRATNVIFLRGICCTG